MRKDTGFSESVRVLFLSCNKCHYCSKNKNDCLHHIVGGGTADSRLENSPFNAAPLCNQTCHLKHHGKFMTREFQSKFLIKTRKYLLESGYKPNKKDYEFMLKYEHVYKKEPK